MIRRKLSEDSDERQVLSRKEVQRLLRKQAYQREKERRAKDPKVLAMKEKVKEQRRELYRREKERRKAERLELKAKEREKKAAERAVADFELMKMIKRATKGSTAEN